jgi:hypothetical protein
MGRQFPSAKWMIGLSVVVVWQVYEIATATEAPSQALAFLQYFLLACGLIGLVGGVVMYLRR